MALRVEERIVAGGAEDDVLVVHHLVLHGSNRAIGRHLGEIARSRHHLSPGDPLRASRLEWLRAHAPCLHERLRGAAEAFCLPPADGALDLSRLGAPPPATRGSAVFVPPRATHAGHALVSRAFDFPAPAGPPPAGAPPGAGRPYVIETYPDAGHASLALVAFDLLGGAFDGVNAAGLAVVAASDLEAAAGAPAPEPGAGGLDELQLARLALDACATAAEARALLVSAQGPCAARRGLCLVADRRGDAFALGYEGGPGGARCVEAEGRPLVLTNHALHRYPGDVELPRAPGPGGTFARYRALRAALAEARGPWTPATLATLALAAERASAAASGAGAADRTLWQGVYDLGAAALDASFFLRDEPDRDRPGARRAVRTPVLRFELSR